MSTFGYMLAWGIVLALAMDLVHGYWTGNGTVWEKMLAAGKSSASILAARVGMLGGAALSVVEQLADVIASPTVKSFIDQYMNAKAVGWTMIAAAFIAEMARRRTLTVPVLGQSGSEEK